MKSHLNVSFAITRAGTIQPWDDTRRGTWAYSRNIPALFVKKCKYINKWAILAAELTTIGVNGFLSGDRVSMGRLQSRWSDDLRKTVAKIWMQEG